MKKILSIILCAAMLFTLCACDAASALKKAPEAYLKKAVAATGEELQKRYGGSPVTVLANGGESPTAHVAVDTVIPDLDVPMDMDFYTDVEKGSAVMQANVDVDGMALDVTVCIEPELIALGSSLLGDTFYGFDPTRLEEQYEGSWVQQLGIIDEESLTEAMDSAGTAAIGTAAVGTQVTLTEEQIAEIQSLLEQSVNEMEFIVTTEKIDVSGKEKRAICGTGTLNEEQTQTLLKQLCEAAGVYEEIEKAAETNEDVDAEEMIEELNDALACCKGASASAYFVKSRLIAANLALDLEEDGEQKYFTTMIHFFDGAENAVSLKIAENGENVAEARSVAASGKDGYSHALTLTEADGTEAITYNAAWTADKALSLTMNEGDKSVLNLVGKLEGTADGFRFTDGEITVAVEDDQLTFPMEVVRDNGADWPEMNITVKNIFELDLMEILPLLGAVDSLT